MAKGLIWQDEENIIDVVYQTIYGLPVKEALHVVDLYANKRLIPIEWIERKLAEHWYVDYDIRELLEDWEKEERG